ncbi:MAG: DNA repair protein RecO [Clostridiales bacterium]|jgi:DNA repair protein RecO (recombination protein O)|nr:DNA repair protein RecO [Clostridiales bacterium]
MIFTTDAVVIRERQAGEADRLLTLLTRDRGIIDAFAKGACRPKNKLHGVTQLFSYASFTFFEGKSVSVNEAQQKELFFGLRDDIERLSLAQYFCEAMCLIVPSNVDSEEYLRLLLNSFHFLSEEILPVRMLKAVFELRIAAIAGYMPDLVACCECGSADADLMYFDIENGVITCKDCLTDRSRLMPINASVLTAMRHIVYSPLKDLFRYSLTGDSLQRLSQVTEAFFLHHMPYTFKTLEFYKSIAT